MYIKPVWSLSNQMFYDSGKSGGRECIKSLECQIGGGLGATIASWNSRSQSENSGRKNDGIVFE